MNKDENEFFDISDGNIFVINFHKIFELEGLEAYKDFDLTAKRNFKNLGEYIKTSYVELFMDEGRINEKTSIILYKILDLQYLLLSDLMSFNTFQDKLDAILASDDHFFLRVISDYVESNYKLSLDSITAAAKQSQKKVNVELQFSDLHAKELIKVAYVYRILIPLISQYLILNKGLFIKSVQSEDTDEDGEGFGIESANMNIFMHLFDTAVSYFGSATALKNKLYKLVYSRIAKTTYSDRRFWALAKNHGITKDTETLDIYRKLLSNAIPKLLLDEDKNVISFFQSVINNQIDFLLQNKFKYKLLALNQNFESYSSSDDDDEVNNEFERLEMQMLRKDEGIYKLRQLNIKEVVNNIDKYLGVSVSNKEAVELQCRINRNTIQERIVSIITLKYFGDSSSLAMLTFPQYCKLVLSCKKYLEKYKFVYLSKIITATCEKHRERATISGKRIKPMIEASKAYTGLFNDKYSTFSKEIERPLSSIIATAYSSVFRDENGKEIFDSSVKVGKIAQEFIELAYIS